MIVVNLYGGPGCGKSTGAAYVFERLKEAGVVVELVTEFAKDLVWDRSDALHDQVFVFANQYHRLARLEKSGVQVAVTDSPLLLSLVYACNDRRLFDMPEDRRCLVSEAAKALSASFDNRDFIVKRIKPYVTLGRNESEQDATAIDRMMCELTGDQALSVDGVSTGYETIVQYVLRELKGKMK